MRMSGTIGGAGAPRRRLRLVARSSRSERFSVAVAFAPPPLIVSFTVRAPRSARFAGAGEAQRDLRAAARADLGGAAGDDLAAAPGDDRLAARAWRRRSVTFRPERSAFASLTLAIRSVACAGSGADGDAAAARARAAPPPGSAAADLRRRARRRVDVGRAPVGRRAAGDHERGLHRAVARLALDPDAVGGLERERGAVRRPRRPRDPGLLAGRAARRTGPARRACRSACRRPGTRSAGCCRRSRGRSRGRCPGGSPRRRRGRSTGRRSRCRRTSAARRRRRRRGGSPASRSRRTAACASWSPTTGRGSTSRR